MSRSILMKVHMLLAAFMLPVAIMYPLTGALYTWGVKGDYDVSKYVINLEKPLTKDKEQLIELVKQSLIKRDLALPTGKAKIKTAGTSFQLEWTGANRDVILAPGTDLLTAQLKIKETTQYRQLVQLHKAKGGTGFKVYAAIFATALLVMLITGFIMAIQMPKYRKSVLFSMGAGIVMFVSMLMSS